MTTINLRDGLEVLYYFGEQDFDPQRNQLQDHSGYGHHASANGSVTVGLNGPSSFEVAKFSGRTSNDGFATSKQFNFDEHTIFLIINIDGADLSQKRVYADKTFGFRLSTNNNSLQYRLQNPDKNTKAVSTNVKPFADKWISLCGRYDGEEMNFVVDNFDFAGSRPFSEIRDRSQVLEISKSSRAHKGQMALAGLWTRSISDAELLSMNSMTAPLRAQL